MKDQASLNLLIVDSPIDSKALTGHLMLRATSTGLKVYDATGSETELGGGGGGETTWDAITGKPESFTPSVHTHAISDITSLQTTLDNKVVKGVNSTLGSTDFGIQTSTGTIAFTTTSGAISLGTVSGGIHLACFESGLDLDGTDVLLNGGGIQFNSHALNTAGGLVKLGEDGKIPSSLYEAGSGGDTSALEERVTTLEGTVGTLDAAVDEILADYGEGSGALVYRVVASATEPENPTEGMIWIQTE